MTTGKRLLLNLARREAAAEWRCGPKSGPQWETSVRTHAQRAGVMGGTLATAKRQALARFAPRLDSALAAAASARRAWEDRWNAVKGSGNAKRAAAAELDRLDSALRAARGRVERLRKAESRIVAAFAEAVAASDRAMGSRGGATGWMDYDA